MKIPTKLLWRILLDVGLQLSDTIDIDYREICSRYEREGMSFLTITLPTLDDALLKGLTKGRLTRSDFPGFRARGRRGSLPALLSGFFRRIFHDDGSIKADPDVCAIFAIRQVARLFKKVELPCSEPRVKAAYGRYLSNDREVDWRRHRQPLDARLWACISGYLWADLERLSGELHCFPGLFGPGATAEQLKRNERRSISRWPERAEDSFPSSFYASHDFGSSGLSGLEFLKECDEQPVRVVQVPKTLKTPRTISVEPSYMMLMQQSIAKPLMMYLESKRFGFKSIRFTDQSVNANLARLGSMDGRLSTIDLKDASDMVDFDLVTSIFRGPCPSFLKLIQDCRSTRAQMPDGTIIPLRKFASMGSAMCFPVESMVFFTIIMYALVKNSGRVPSRRLLLKLAKDVAVYGDDIVVPSAMAPVVMETLEDFGLKVNHDKSFHTGLFRESCGGDYYNGVDVTPAYVRQWDDTGTLSKPSHKVAYVALSNTFYMKGLWHASQYLRDAVDVRTRDRIPFARNPIGVLHYSSFIRDSNLSYDSRLHGYRVKGHRIRVSRQPDTPSNVSGFLELCFGSRYFRESLQKLNDQARFQAPHWVYERHVQMGFRMELQEERLSYDPRRDLRTKAPQEENDTHLRASSYSDWARNGVCSERLFAAQSKRALASAERLMHLTTVSGTSLNTSERPHALCLKRGWTASQAGLHW